MVNRVVLPKLGLTMDEGRIARWVKQEGDTVEKGEILLEVETDKATVEVESPASGVLRSIVVPEGETVPVAQLIGFITDSADEPLPDGGAATATSSPVQQTVPTESPAAQVQPAGRPAREETQPAGALKAAPAARRLAQELGVNLSTVTGSGPGGRITTEDVEKAAQGPSSQAQAAPPATSASGTAPLSRMRKAIAERMTLSRREVPQFTLSTDVDMSGAVELRQRSLEQVQREHNVRLTYTDILVQAVTRALRRHPEVNASYVEDGPSIQTHEQVNIGIAVALEQGLIVPVMADADRKSLGEIAAARQALVEAAKSGRLGSAESSGATFTISNLGSYRVDRFDAIINPPEAAILAVGRMQDRVVAKDGWFAVRPTMTLTLTCDHRVLDGASGARFLQTLAEELESAQA